MDREWRDTGNNSRPSDLSDTSDASDIGLVVPASNNGRDHENQKGRDQ